jgi:hypothetical protein
MRPTPQSKDQQIRKLTKERDNARGQLVRIKTDKKVKRIMRRRQSLGVQVLTLTSELEDSIRRERGG